MARDEQFDAAKKLTEAFVAQLRALAGGNIPGHWAIYVKKALSERKGHAGRKIDADQLTALARLLVLHADSLHRQRSKHHSPATSLQDIAREVGLSPKQAGRYKDAVDMLDKQGALTGSPEARRALLDGVAQGLAEQIMADVKEEEALARQYQAHRSRK